MSQWETGILRKNKPTENHDELLVFGYACKLFRDDDKAQYIDQGKHLIPWMGNDQLKIDRYDCRGALSDLNKFEASREGYDAMRWLGLSDKERQLEELCDKERYYSLVINEEEEQMYKEEEIKRQKTNAFPYSYDVQQNPEEIKKEDGKEVETEEEEQGYVPPPSLDVPVDIEIPKSVKENARIEKTALFVCKQGPQMEILIKAKQSNNPQFSFLNRGDHLHKFYRHVLAAFKAGRYKGYDFCTENKNEEKNEEGVEDEDSHYLHPSLTSNVDPNPRPESSQAVPIPQVRYKPSLNCAYMQLVNRIQGSSAVEANASSADEQAKSGDFSGVGQGQMTYEQQQQYYQYYYAQQYYEYYKQTAFYRDGQAGSPVQFVPPADFESLDPHIQHYVQQIAYSGYLQQSQRQPESNSYAQIVNNVLPLCENDLSQSSTVHSVAESEKSEKPVESSAKKQDKVEKVASKAKVEVSKPLLSLAAYGSGSGSDSEDSDGIESTKVPSGEKKVVIDKMAVYVSKNGEQFEGIIKEKNDPRFDFLNANNEFYGYYKQKLWELQGAKRKEGAKNEGSSREGRVSKREKKVIAPVCFSIKKPKEDTPKDIKSALPVEESDDEDPENQENDNTSANNETLAVQDGQSPAAENAIEVGKIEEEIEECVGAENKKNGSLLADDPILEMIELASQEANNEKKDLKRAEDKIKDKLVLAARERLAFASRDRALQLERKKKAAAFLKLKSAAASSLTGDVEADSAASKAKAETYDLTDVKAVSDSSSRRNSSEVIEVSSGSSKANVESLSELLSKSMNDKGKDNKEVRKRAKRSKSRERRRDKGRERSKRKEKDSDRDKRRERERVRERSRSRSEARLDCSDGSDAEKGRHRKTDDGKFRDKRKKTSRKRKHSKSRHETRSKKKSKKRHRRSESASSRSSYDS